MRIQISAGQGPAECELAVGKLLQEIRRREEVLLIDAVRGAQHDCYKSVLLSGGEGLLRWVGTVQWICQSPFRPRHKRKNWFVDVSRCDAPEEVAFDAALVRFETFRCSGNGGQNVNKVESGVRAVYLPTGDATVSMDERSQYRNKQIALERIRKAVEERNRQLTAETVNSNWRNHTGLTRGDAVAVYWGMEFSKRQ